MKVIAALGTLFLLNATPPSSMAQTPTEPLKSRPEILGYKETSHYSDVIAFFNDLQQRSPLMRTEIFGHSFEGRALPLVILADPPISQPAEARASGKPVIFIMANIHAGEVEGKEAMQHLAQRILTGDLHPLLDKLVILIAPIYNADGNEKISVHNRTDQYGPIGGVGARENSQGLDLNRDYMKLEAPESQALVRLLNRWDPHVTVDLHTTDGSYHAYHLTYSPTLNPNANPKLISYERDKMLPAITEAMLKEHKFRTYYYGNFSTKDALERELNRPAVTKPGEQEKVTVWRTFDHRPRFGNNYVGLRNRLTILSEAYSHLDFKGRVEVTEAFVEEICKYAASHPGEIREVTRVADEETVRSGLGGSLPPFGVEFETRPLAEPVDLLVGEVAKVKNPNSGIDMIAMVEGKATPTKMPDYGVFAATRTAPMPRAYFFRPGFNPGVVLEKLQAHGVAVEELSAAFTGEAENFVIREVKKSARVFQGHKEVKLAGNYEKETITFPAGTIFVRTAQPLGILAAYLLEPESDDGLTAWNFFDDSLEAGKTYPISKLSGDIKVASRLAERAVEPPTETRSK